jgi:hypothetical protein
MRWSLQSVLVAVLVVLLALTAFAQRANKRLILKDGSYQPVREWKVEGDRVTYFSTERFAWEELPNELIDWDATNRYNSEAPGKRELPVEAREVSAEEQAERAAEAARSPEVAPGVKLPTDGGVFLLDNFQGQPQLVELVQNGGEIQAERGKNILRAAINPFGGSRQPIELKGPRARIQAHEMRPVIFINIMAAEPDPNEDAEDRLPLGTNRFHIARLRKKDRDRVVAELKINMIGRIKEVRNLVAVDATPISGGWFKIEPLEPLQPGEYALIEMLSRSRMNLYVWDFGIDPSAPQNPKVWTPIQVKTDTGTQETPVLKRPR